VPERIQKTNPNNHLIVSVSQKSKLFWISPLKFVPLFHHEKEQSVFLIY